MAYTFNFSTVAQYRAAKASGGAIYNALRPGSTPNVSRSAVSYIAELGRSVIDGVNVCVPYSQGGQIGDIKCYSASYGEFWLKCDTPSWSSDSLGQMYFDSTTWPSSFVRIGFVFHLSGNGGLLCALSDESKAWSTDTTTEVSGIATTTQTNQGKKRMLASWISGASREITESWFGSTMYYYVWPLPRTLWDAAVEAAKKGITASGSVSDTTTTAGTTYTTSWSASGGVAKISVRLYGLSAAVDVNPADYGYDFDRWYDENVACPVPGRKGSATSEMVGSVRNDGVRATRLMKNTGNSPAADYALSFSVSAPGYSAGMWWIPSLPELVLLARQIARLNKAGAGLSKSVYWSSTQYAATYAWSVVFYNGLSTGGTKTYTYRVRPVSDFRKS